MHPPWVESETSLPLATDRDTRIVAVADTHSRPHPALLDHVAALRPDLILHAGDMGSRSVLDTLGEIAPVYPVRGNVDARASDWPDSRVVELAAPNRKLRLFLTHVGLHGVRLRADVAERARAGGATVVVCGHSHLPFIGQHGKLAIFNPGSCGPRRFTLPIVFGTIDVTSKGLRFGHVDCETGRPWHPPG